MKSLKENIDLSNLPQHIAVIMDGNGRWANKRGALRLFGHKSAVKSVKSTVENCAELGINYLTLYAFSKENWSRPQDEVDGLMELLVNTIHHEIKSLNKNQIRLLTIGDTKQLPNNCYQELEDAKKLTQDNKGLTLVLALNYSGRWDITNAINKIIEKNDGKPVSQEDVKANLDTVNIPDPELLIRTSGEIRLSNFLLWESAYTEFYFTDTLWPDFNKEELYKAINTYQQRERRFGRTGEQIKEGK